MATSKIVLNDFYIEAFHLCAIHANIPSYKMAFLLNKNLGLRLQRAENDVEVGPIVNEEVYPKYVFENDRDYITYTLVKNKCIAKRIDNSKASNLFSEGNEVLVATNLVFEHKNVDYFLKIESDSEFFGTRFIISQIKKINQVITAYSVDYTNLKKKTNLIFE